MGELKISSVSDKYIDYLLSDYRLRNVLSNKENELIHTRKYLGVVISKNGFNYYIPFSSPKENDYFFNEQGKKYIRKSIIPIIRMTTVAENGELELKGKLKLSSMIPVPETELIDYDILKETDLNYKTIVEKEYEFISSNRSMIINYANVIYNQKINEEYFLSKEKPLNYLKNTVDFKYAELKCEEFIRAQMKDINEIPNEPQKKSFKEILAEAKAKSKTLADESIAKGIVNNKHIIR